VVLTPQPKAPTYQVLNPVRLHLHQVLVVVAHLVLVLVAPQGPLRWLDSQLQLPLSLLVRVVQMSIWVWALGALSQLWEQGFLRKTRWL